ncbi:MAG: hypoxanthine phosphoribosyltransferase [Sediminibacterium sp.]|nr:hypoxanthine phosphoribosyltransferase [Sediminibacterium sp.]
MQNEVQIKDKIFEKFITEEVIAKRVKDIAEEIKSLEMSHDLIFICILNGSFIFAAELFKRFNVETKISFVKLLSYSGTSSTGKVINSIGLDISVKDKNIIIIEDIVETGHTLRHFIDTLKEQNPNFIKVCALLYKPDCLKHPEINIDFLGFEIPNDFVVGYGLDYDGFGRNLPDIYKLKE